MCALCRDVLGLSYSTRVLGYVHVYLYGTCMYVCMYVCVCTYTCTTRGTHTCTYPSTRVRTRILASRSTCTFMVHGKRVLVLGQKKRVLGVPWYLYGIAIHGKRVLVRIKSYCNIAIPPCSQQQQRAPCQIIYLYLLKRTPKSCALRGRPLSAQAGHANEKCLHLDGFANSAKVMCAQRAPCRRRPDTRMKNACIWTGSTSITTSALLDCRRRCCVLFVRYVCWRNQSVGTNGY